MASGAPAGWAPPRHWYADALRGVLPVSTAESEVGEAMSWPQVPPLAELHSRRSEKWDGYDPDVVVATIAEMDFCLDPSIAAALHSAIDRHDLGYAHERIPALAEAFAGFAARRLNWCVDPAQVRLMPDVMLGILELSRLLAGRGGSVALATPAYPPFLTELPAVGLTVRQLALLPDGAVDLDALTVELDRGTRVVVLANPHNPTGRVSPRVELAQIAEMCAERCAFVIADEIHGPLVLPGADYTPWLEVSDAARDCGVALTSASKAFNLAGLKAALLVTGSAGTRAAVSRLLPLGEHAGLLGVIAGEVAFTSGDTWLDGVLAQLDANRALLQRLLPLELPAVVWTPPQATYMAWLDCRGLQLGDDPAATMLRRGRVALSSGLQYGDAGAGHVRLNFGTSAELVAEVVHRMAASVPDTSASSKHRRGGICG